MNSPFSYKYGMIHEDEAEIKQMGDINQLITNKVIDETDLKILSLIHRFRLLTAEMISTYFKDDKIWGPNFSKNRLRKYMKNGLTRRFYVRYANDELYSRTVNFYTLSDASIAFLKKYSGLQVFKIEQKDMLNVGDVLSNLAINQMLINYSLGIDDFIRYEYEPKKSRRFAKVTLSNHEIGVFCIRKDQNFELLSNKIKDVSKDVDSVLLLFEDELFMVESHFKHMHDYLKPLFYITDLMMVSRDMNESILKVTGEINKPSILEYKFKEMREKSGN